MAIERRRARCFVLFFLFLYVATQPVGPFSRTGVMDRIRRGLDRRRTSPRSIADPPSRLLWLPAARRRAAGDGRRTPLSVLHANVGGDHTSRRISSRCRVGAYVNPTPASGSHMPSCRRSYQSSIRVGLLTTPCARITVDDTALASVLASGYTLFRGRSSEGFGIVDGPPTTGRSRWLAVDADLRTCQASVGPTQTMRTPVWILTSAACCLRALHGVRLDSHAAIAHH